MAWTNLTYAFESVLTSAKQTQLYDNLTAMAQGLTGAPKILDAAFNDDAITQKRILIPKVHVYRNTDQVIPNVTQTSINFDQERYDNDNIHDNTTNNERLICKTAGVYAIFGYVSFRTTAESSSRELWLFNQAATILDYDLIPESHNNPATLRVYTEVQLAVNDFVYLSVRQLSGGNLDVFAGNESPRFGMHRIG